MPLTPEKKFNSEGKCSGLRSFHLEGSGVRWNNLEVLVLLVQEIQSFRTNPEIVDNRIAVHSESCCRKHKTGVPISVGNVHRSRFTSNQLLDLLGGRHFCW